MQNTTPIDILNEILMQPSQQLLADRFANLDESNANAFCGGGGGCGGVCGGINDQVEVENK